MSDTAAEIAQQPAAWRLLAEMLADRREEIRAFTEPLLARPDLRIVLTGAGTSAYAGQILAPALARALRRRVDAIATTDIVASPDLAFAEDVPTLLVSFARSGDSPESIAALGVAHRCLGEVHHLVVTCNPEGGLARECPPSSVVLLMPDGTNDRGFAMTSSFTCMLLAGWLVLGPDRPGLAEDLATAGEVLLAETDALTTRLAQEGHDRVVYLGSGTLTGLARESSLKLTELTAGSVVSWAESALGFRHGPKAVLRPRTLAVVYLSNDPHTRLYDEDIAAELREELGAANVLAVGAPPGLDDVDDAALAVVLVLLAQRIALRFALAAGIRPDNPFPGGQVNRVVQGVTVHAYRS